MLENPGTSLEEGWSRYLDSSIFQAYDGSQRGTILSVELVSFICRTSFGHPCPGMVFVSKSAGNNSISKKNEQRDPESRKKKLTKTRFTRAFRVRTSLFAVAVSRVLLMTRKSSMVVSSLFATIFVTSDSLDMLFSII